MNKSPSRKRSKTDEWPRKVRLGRVTVPVYRRRTPMGNFAFMVANHSEKKRRFDCYPTEGDAMEAANKLARRMSEKDVLAARMTEAQAIDYAGAVQALEGFNVSLTAVANAVAESLKHVGGLSDLQKAAKAYAVHRKRTIPRPVAEVVADLLEVKEGLGMSDRYLQDLRARLGRFAQAFKRNLCDVTTSDVQAWFDGLGAKPQNLANFRRVVHLLFEFGVARGYAANNVVAGTESVKVRRGKVAVFSPAEVSRLLSAASPEFRPCIALGAFAGLRSAEIERLEWSDIQLAEKFIIIGEDRSKTASRRIVPIHDNLAQWLMPYAGNQGLVWRGTHDEFYDAQQQTSAATKIDGDPDKAIRAEKAVEWRANALRHSYASYRFAQIGDAGRVAGELGNSASVVHKHYRELVKPADAERWFNVRPEMPANVLAIPGAASI